MRIGRAPDVQITGWTQNKSLPERRRLQIDVGNTLRQGNCPPFKGDSLDDLLFNSSAEAFPLTREIFSRILEYLEATTGNSRSKLIVHVRGYGDTYAETDTWTGLEVGKIIAIEEKQHGEFLEEKIRGQRPPSPRALEALNLGGLEIKESSDNLPQADIIVWNFPGPDGKTPETMGIGLRVISYENLISNLAPGGIIIIQSENPRYFGCFKNDANFAELVFEEVSETSYLLPSGYLLHYKLIWLGIYQKGQDISPDLNP